MGFYQLDRRWAEDYVVADRSKISKSLAYDFSNILAIIHDRVPFTGALTRSACLAIISDRLPRAVKLLNQLIALELLVVDPANPELVRPAHRFLSRISADYSTPRVQRFRARQTGPTWATVAATVEINVLQANELASGNGVSETQIEERREEDRSISSSGSNNHRLECGFDADLFDRQLLEMPSGINSEPRPAAAEEFRLTGNNGNQSLKAEGVAALFALWNRSPGTMRHGRLATHAAALTRAIERYDYQSCVTAITRWSEVRSDSQLWSHDWSVTELITRKGGLTWEKLLADDYRTQFRDYGKDQHYAELLKKAAREEE